MYVFPKAPFALVSITLNLILHWTSSSPSGKCGGKGDIAMVLFHPVWVFTDLGVLELLEESHVDAQALESETSTLLMKIFFSQDAVC